MKEIRDANAWRASLTPIVQMMNKNSSKRKSGMLRSREEKLEEFENDH